MGKQSITTAKNLPVGEQLRQARTAQGLTLNAVAANVGMNAWNIGNIERGILQPQLSTLTRLAEAYGLEVALVKKGKSE